MVGRSSAWWLALAVVTLVTPALLAGCLGAELRPVVAASAPREASGLTLFIETPSVSLGDRADPQAYYRIDYQGRGVYPPRDVWGAVPLADGRGNLYVPYAYFVVGNGQYDVRVRWNDDETTTQVPIERWVEYVYLHPFVKRESSVTVDVLLATSRGGSLTDRVLTNGRLVFDIYYRGASTSAGVREWISRVQYVTDTEADFVRVEIPRARFGNDVGYYSLESKFDNDDALGNYNVGNDPTMAARDPPWNWVWLS